MTRKMLSLALLSLFLTSCATAQIGALSLARKATGKQNFHECLVHLGNAENYGDRSDSINAQIAFEKGICLEGLGRKAEAKALYRNLVEKYPNSDWAAQAKARLE